MSPRAAKTLFRRAIPPVPRARKPLRLRIDDLETRAVPATVNVTPLGVLRIVGTDAAEKITVTGAGGSATVIVEGPGTQTFNRTGVRSVRIEAFGGNDEISNTAMYPTTIVAGAGNDTVTVDVVNGLVAKRAVIHGGDGDDAITNTSGPSSLVTGGAGHDVIQNTAGVRSSVTGGAGNEVPIDNSPAGIWARGRAGGDNGRGRQGQGTP